LKYNDGTPIRAGDVVTTASRPERYIVIGLHQNSIRILIIGTVTKEGAPWFGETIVRPQGFTQDVPAGVLTKIGSARITIVDEDPKMPMGF